MSNEHTQAVRGCGPPVNRQPVRAGSWQVSDRVRHLHRLDSTIALLHRFIHFTSRHFTSLPRDLRRVFQPESPTASREPHASFITATVDGQRAAAGGYTASGARQELGSVWLELHTLLQPPGRLSFCRSAILSRICVFALSCTTHKISKSSHSLPKCSCMLVVVAALLSTLPPQQGYASRSLLPAVAEWLPPQINISSPSLRWFQTTADSRT